ncbi:MAG TPA: flavodoxin family protein [Candidatus Cloacimonadota bacterium]|nr:flavodoxin family protein [Candidatus Cloacimonadota bacterium]
MKVFAINGSPRKDGNTSFLIKKVFEELEKNGIETEIYTIGNENFKGCIGCRKCYENKDMKCVIQSDSLNEIFQKCAEADGILIASPVYFADITANTKAFIERAGSLTRANNNILARKPGAGIVAVRRGGAIHSFDSINHFFLISQMLIVGSSYWNIGIGGPAGDCENDAEGIKTMQTLGTNMSWVLQKLNQ